MLAVLIATSLFAAPQGPSFDDSSAPATDAVAVRGEAELSPAEAYASASRAAEEHLRERWQARAARTAELRRPFWVPEVLVEQHIRRWLADLPIEGIAKVVDRQDRERMHEFGNSYQTTLWIAEEPRRVAMGEQRLRSDLRRLEHATAIKYGGIVAGWALLALVIGWLDRLSRGYMTGRLRLVGVLAGAAVPIVAFLV